MPRRVFEKSGGPQGSSRSYDYDGQHYRHVGRRPHDCADGRPVEIDVWVSECATCGAPFEVSRVANSHRKFSVNRRCPAHRRPGARVSAELNGTLAPARKQKERPATARNRKAELDSTRATDERRCILRAAYLAEKREHRAARASAERRRADPDLQPDDLV
jgi:hypothetical protein